MTVWHGITIPLLVAAALVVGYYWLLAIGAVLSRRAAPVGGGLPPRRLAVVIPAHNERGTIAAAVESCRTQDYPRDQLRIYVVADNCTDDTAEAARRAGAVCLERSDAARRGKGHALAWACERLAGEDWDALIVLDADCRFTPNSLACLNGEFAGGGRVLQANLRGVNTDDSAISYVSRVGNALEKELFYGGKRALGGAVLLSGTGMAFAREVLDDHPWRAHSPAEDVEYALELLQAGVTIRFVRDAIVLHEAAANGAQLTVQRTRWAGGMLRLALHRAAPLFLRGLAARRFVLCDAAWTMLVISRPLVMLLLTVGVAFSVACLAAAPGTASTACLATAVGLVVALAAYVALGVVWVGLSWRRLGLLVQMPWVVTRMLFITLRGAALQGGREWRRTPRPAEQLEASGTTGR